MGVPWGTVRAQSMRWSCQQLTWSFHWGSFRKSLVSRGNPCIKREWYIAFIDLTKAFSLVSTLLKKIGCPTPQAPKDDHVFPWRHARNRPVLWLDFRPNQERSDGSVLAPTLLLPHSSASFSPCCCLTGLQPVRGWYVPSHQKWWKPLQPCTPLGKDQGSKITDKGDAVCRWHCSNRTHWRWFTATHQLLRTRL